MLSSNAVPKTLASLSAPTPQPSPSFSSFNPLIPEPLPNLSSLGPAGLGTLLDLFLFGALTTQTYIYYLGFPNDRKLLKAAVLCVYVVGIVQTVFAIIDLYGISVGVVPSFDDEGVVEGGSFQPPLNEHTWFTIVVSGVVVAAITQALYAHRIHVISGKIWIPILIICLSLGQIATGMVGVYCIYVYGGDILDGNSGETDGTFCIIGFNVSWGCFNTVCDVTIAIYMIYLLLRKRSKILKHQTRRHVDSILQIIIQSGTITSFFVITFTILFVLWYWPRKNIFPNTESGQIIVKGVYHGGDWFFTPGLAMSKIYSNAMLALLNNRMAISNGRNEEGGATMVSAAAVDLNGPDGIREPLASDSSAS